MKPAAKVVVLTAGSVVGAGIGVIVATGLGWTSGAGVVLPVAVATGLCLSTALATMLLADAVFRRAPEVGPVAVMAGTAVRMVVAVVGAALLAEVLARYGVSRTQFAVWVTYLYIVTLALECGLLMAGLGGAGPTTGVRP